MPRKSTVEELQSEEPAAGSPVRRSSRLTTGNGNGNGNGTPGAQRSAQTTEPNPPARVLRTRRASAQDTEEVEKPAPKPRRASILAEEEQSSTPVRRGRKPSVTKESEEETVKPKSVRGRRASNADSDDKPVQAAGVRTRRGSANVESEPVAAKTPAKVPARRRSSASEVAAVEEASTPAKRTTRGRRNSDVEIIEDAKPATRGRKKSITQEEETKVEEKKPVARRGRRASTDSLASDTGPGTPSRRTTRRSSVNQEEEIAEVNNVEISPVIKITPFKKRGIIEQVEADLDLSIINESDDGNISDVDVNNELENKQVSPTSRKRLSTIAEIGSPSRKSPRLSEIKDRKLNSSPQRVNSPTIINLDTPPSTSPKVRTSNSSQIIINQETQVTTTSNDSFTQKSQITEELNTSTGSNKENITINEILEKSVQGPITFSARVSNVFKPNQREYSFMEPMEVDQTINQSLMEKTVSLDKSFNSPLAKEKIVADSTSDQEKQDDDHEKPILKKLSVILYNSDKLKQTEKGIESFTESKEKIVADSTNNQKNRHEESFSAIKTPKKGQDEIEQDLNVTNKSLTRSEDSDVMDLAEGTELDESLVVFGEEPADSDVGVISVRVIKETDASEVNFLQPKEEVEETCSEADLLDLKEEVEIKDEIEEPNTVELLMAIGGKSIATNTPTEVTKVNSPVINETLEIDHSSSPLDSRRKSLRKSRTPQTRKSLQSKDKDGDKIGPKTPQEKKLVQGNSHDSVEKSIEHKDDKDRDTVKKLKTKKLEDENILIQDSEDEDDVNTNNINKAGEIEKASEDREQSSDNENEVVQEIEVAEETVKKLNRKLELQKELFDESEDEDDVVNTNNINKAEDAEQVSESGNESLEKIEVAEETVKKPNRKLELQKELFDDSEDENDDVNTSNKNKAGKVEKANEDGEQASENKNESVKEIQMAKESAKKLNIRKLEVQKELFDDSEDEDDDVNTSNINKAADIEKANEDGEQALENKTKSVKEIEMAKESAKKLNIRKLEVQKELFDDSEDDDVNTNNINEPGKTENPNEDGKEVSETKNESVKHIENANESAKKRNSRQLEVQKKLFDDSEDDVVNTNNINKPVEIENSNEDEKEVSQTKNVSVKQNESAKKRNSRKLEVEKELFDDSEDDDVNTNTINETGEIEKANEDQENGSEAVDEMEVAEEAPRNEDKAENGTIMTNKISKKATPTKPSPKSKRSLDEFASTKLAEYFESKTDYVENSTDEEESEVENSFVDGMAEEGEEDTPSEDSNQIIDHGESIGSSDSVDEEQSIDEDDSFICDDEDPGELLSGEEYDLDNEETAKKKSRIMNNDQFGDEEVIKMPEKKEKPKRILTRIVTVSSSSDEEIVDEPIEEDKPDSEDKENIQENQLNSVCEIQESKSNNDSVGHKVSIDEEATENRPALESVDLINESIIATDDSKTDELRRSLNVLNQSRHRKSSLTIQENIFVDGSRDPTLTQRINSLVESFCSNVKKGEVSLNLSLEFENTGEEEDTAKSVNILSNVTIQKGTDTEIIDNNGQEEISEAGPSDELENIADLEEENIINQPEIIEEEIWENIEEIIPSDDSEIEELNKSAEQVDLRDVINRKLKRRLSKSLSEVYEENKKAKKRKKNNGKAKPRPDLTDYLGATSFGLMNQLITDVKNRPRRKMKPSTSAVVDKAWTSTVVSNLKPSTSVLKEEKKPVPKPKLHPKDFKNQMLTDPIRVRRVETKTLLKKKGAFF